MIFRPFTSLCLVAFLGAGMHVYSTKHEAAVMDRELRSIARKVEEAEARTQTLQAEWAWLNEPERLRAVAQRHLPELEAMQPAQFVRASEAERRLPAVAAYDGPVALFAPREPVMPAGNTALALLPRVAEPVVQVAVAAPAAAVATSVVARAPAPVEVPAVSDIDLPGLPLPPPEPVAPPRPVAPPGLVVPPRPDTSMPMLSDRTPSTARAVGRTASASTLELDSRRAPQQGSLSPAGWPSHIAGGCCRWPGPSPAAKTPRGAWVSEILFYVAAGLGSRVLGSGEDASPSS